MSNNKLAKDGLNKVWLKGWELLYTLIGDVNTDKGTLQEQIDYVAENSTAMKDITQSDFDAKTDEEKAGKLWNITDATEVPISAILINDQAPSASMAYSSQKVEELVQPKYSNPNLLDNGWFTVNQRGKSEYSGAGYSVDRWRANPLVNASGDIPTAFKTIVNSDGSITFSMDSSNPSGTRAVLEQVFESNEIGLYTFSANIVSCSNTVNMRIQETNSPWELFNDKDFTNEETGIRSVTANVTKKNIVVRFIIGVGDSITIKSAKLELGSVSTLAMDTAPNYATELAKCQSSKADIADPYANIDRKEEIAIVPLANSASSIYLYKRDGVVKAGINVETNSNTTPGMALFDFPEGFKPKNDFFVICRLGNQYAFCFSWEGHFYIEQISGNSGDWLTISEFSYFI